MFARLATASLVAASHCAKALPWAFGVSRLMSAKKVEALRNEKLSFSEAFQVMWQGAVLAGSLNTMLDAALSRRLSYGGAICVKGVVAILSTLFAISCLPKKGPDKIFEPTLDLDSKIREDVQSALHQQAIRYVESVREAEDLLKSGQAMLVWDSNIPSDLHLVVKRDTGTTRIYSFAFSEEKEGFEFWDALSAKQQAFFFSFKNLKRGLEGYFQFTIYNFVLELSAR